MLTRSHGYNYLWGEHEHLGVGECFPNRQSILISGTWNQFNDSVDLGHPFWNEMAYNSVIRKKIRLY